MLVLSLFCVWAFFLCKVILSLRKVLYKLNFWQLNMEHQGKCAEKLPHVRACSSDLQALSIVPRTVPFLLLLARLYPLFKSQGAIHLF